MSTTYTVRAVRWKGGWELHIDDVGVTQARSLAVADRQVRDYIETLLDVDTRGAEIIIESEIESELRHSIDRAFELRRSADEAQARAALAIRDVIAQFDDHGYSGADAAVLLGVTKGRISQLKADSADRGTSSAAG